ncbi:BQ5605_C007g04857 [Microbotryum silenes-dioicae]|uniref:BQ5605_C007g04857 protein n=1 Tax=Microbotryum silenes-dioicae TaxID=796604 RepID=A0A2X0M835_9BASI|nr:BQ5605_C007g04857 [Microbotryum silenes-dioicae]
MAITMLTGAKLLRCFFFLWAREPNARDPEYGRTMLECLA